jgi:hypothetical protein
MGRFMIGLAVLVIAVLGAATAATISLTAGTPLPGNQTIAGWTAFNSLATTQGSVRKRALWAQSAFAVMPPERALYFISSSADNGHDLEGGCRYQVTGTPPNAPWWSLIVYDRNLALIRSDGARSINPDTVQLDANGNYTVYVSAVTEPGNWLSDRSAGTISIVYRIYEPSPDLLKSLPTAALPRVVQSGGCG